MVRRKNGTKHAFWGLPKSYGQRPLKEETGTDLQVSKRVQECKSKSKSKQARKSRHSYGKLIHV